MDTTSSITPPPADSQPVRGVRISVREFGWHYAGREKPTIESVNLTIEPGQKVLLLGSSGAGKSTLLHAMGGLLHDDDGQSQQGTITIDGIPAEDAHGAVGLMQQDPESSIVLSRIGDDVAFGPENLGVPHEQIWERVKRALADVGLEKFDLSHPTSALSGGQKQRLGLAGILAMHPGGIFLDEPTANLDPAGVEDVRDAVIRAQKHTGATLVVIEHRVGVWAEHMDRIIVLSAGGRVTHDGSPTEVLAEAKEELISAGVWVPDYTPEVLPSTQQAGAELICARNVAVTRHYPSARERRKRRKALKNCSEPYIFDAPIVSSGINASIRAGEHTSVLGCNGAGKSTFALTLAGLLYPVSGEIVATSAFLEEAAPSPSRQYKEPSPDMTQWRSRDIASRIGLVFQEPEQQFLTATVREELEFGPRQLARLRQEPVDEQALKHRIDALSERLRLRHLEGANPFTLSGGEKRRLSVATALATAPQILILDEPTFGQDAHTWKELVLLIQELLEQGTAVVSVTHDDDFVRALGGIQLRLIAESDYHGEEER
ncbi:ABC transporter ATP-binding protein [Rothia sp. P7181]|uniref:ABC transporter ATP-binding protein n=1 Tax=Rothia sp. P7181 TaxID=3402663 RepID=UPI003AE82D2D